MDSGFLALCKSAFLVENKLFLDIPPYSQLSLHGGGRDHDPVGLRFSRAWGRVGWGCISVATTARYPGYAN